jgi:hypothetical protein
MEEPKRASRRHALLQGCFASFAYYAGPWLLLADLVLYLIVQAGVLLYLQPRPREKHLLDRVLGLHAKRYFVLVEAQLPHNSDGVILQNVVCDADADQVLDVFLRPCELAAREHSPTPPPSPNRRRWLLSVQQCAPLPPNYLFYRDAEAATLSLYLSHSLSPWSLVVAKTSS